MVSEKIENVWSVFDVNASKYQPDYTGVEEFGKLCEIFKGRKVAAIDLMKQEEIIRTDVLPFASRHDFILTLGPSIMVASLAAMFASEFGVVNFLMWNRGTNGYFSRYINTGMPAR